MDCLVGLKLLPDKSVHCVVTSPPYWGLRDYGVKGQIGLEKTPKAFIRIMVRIFKEVKRVLRDDGTLWLNIGDSYASLAGGYSSSGSRGKNSVISEKTQAAVVKSKNRKPPIGLKPKDLVGIPWMLAFALRDAGWYLRQDIIWHKPNPMPESANDRCTKSHEYIFLLSKSNRYYYDQKAIATPYADKTYTTFGIEIKGSGDQTGLIMAENRANSMAVHKAKKWKSPDGWDTGPGSHGTIHRNGREKGKPFTEHKNLSRDDKNHSFHEARKGKQIDNSAGINGTGFKGHSGNKDANGDLIGDGLANKRSVWTVATKPFSEAHFATFPEELILDCIKAGCPEGGIVLDPFMGAGTTALVAQKLNRNFIGFELNPAYIKIANKRLNSHLGMFSPDHIREIKSNQLTIE